MKQRTIKRPVALEGIGQHTGKKTSLNLRPSPADSGINFIRVDLPNKPLINIQSLDLGTTSAKSRRTTLKAGEIEIDTVEHLMAALSALAIDSIIAEVDSAELPGLDGSAKGFFDALKGAGVKELEAESKALAVKEPVWVEDEGSFLGIFPGGECKVSYALSFTKPTVFDEFFATVVNEKTFEKDIAPARTFCFEEEALALLKMGFGKGADYNNTLVIGVDGPVRNTLRFPNEPARHKVLDLIGDLYLLGRQLKGHVVAIKSGHKLNVELVRKLRGDYGNG